MAKFRILMLGGGKRVSLGRRFIEAGEREGLNVEILSYDLSATEPICTIGRAIAGLRWNDPEVAKHLTSIVEAESIDLVVSNVDQATVIHASLRDVSRAFALSCDTKNTETCLSKVAFQSACEDLCIPVPPLADGTTFPLFAKPIFGSSSVGAQLVLDRSRWNDLVSEEVEYIFQRAINGTEYSIDAYVSRDGVIRGVSPRTRDVIVGGEVEISTTVHDDEIVALSRNVIERLSLVGPLTLQMFRETESQSLYVIEVNPRFGGGVPLSIEAGFDFPAMMIREMLGDDPGLHADGRRIRMTRYFQEYFHAIDH
jgi:carbamoyl-phosphate synthase large subunit